ncbi:hypothetical protein FQZ97_575930 [compost metagenome]
MSSNIENTHKFTFDLSDPDEIFGNEAAEDEKQDKFLSYAVRRPEIKRFTNPDKPIQVVRAFKGEGKSALLRLIDSNLKSNESTIIIKTTGQALSPSVNSEDSDEWVRAWKANILKNIANEIGSRLNFAFTDDAISLVEEAERSGFKSRSFISSIFDRLKTSAVPLERTRPAIENPEKILGRWLENSAPIWMILDDIDQNFQNTPKQKIKVASCFIAVRQILSQIPETRFRLCVRPNVWASIKPDYEALSHVEQYMVDLSWPDESFEGILARRVEGYLKVTQQIESESKKSNSELINLLFENPVLWGSGGKPRPMHIALHTLSRHRPRWLVELCKLASLEANRNGREKITLDDIVKQLDDFGQRRIEDTIAEFRPQCPQIENLIVAFADQPERFTTDELLRTIRDRIQPGVLPKIEGVIGVPSAKEIAHFLFEIGFLSARRDHANGEYEHISFDKRPNLLRATTNVDEGVSWEIHPVFRRTLRLKNVESKSERANSPKGPIRKSR